MACYLPPIDNPDAIYQVQILRYDPDEGRPPHWETFEIPHVPTMTVMEALEYLWDQGEYIAFRANCREFTCGSCAMEIDGRPGVACDTLLRDGMRLAPLSRFPVARDLVVDQGEVRERLRDIAYWPEGPGTETGVVDRVDPDVQGRFHHIYARCIDCYSCLDACPQSRTPKSRFDGPMYFVHLSRVHDHPLDGRDRVKDAAEHGVWSCINCYECASVCPVGLSPASVIADLRGKAVRRPDLLWGMLIGRYKEDEGR